MSSKKAEPAKDGKKPLRAVKARAGKIAQENESALVVVESPAKAKTIKKYLGSALYTVKASVGHVKDLPKSTMGVDIDKGFQPTYEVIHGKAKVLSEIKSAARKAGRVLLATDPDREGEAIAWHIGEEIGKPGKTFRVLFNEITKKAIQEAIQNPQALDRMKFDSQQARRILDRLVGYQISPILWKKVRRGLSAGRVQSVAVRLVVEREREIQAFLPKEYWSLEADLQARLPPQFRARLTRIAGQKAELADKAQTDAVVQGLAGAKWIVQSVERKERRRNPAPPFTTSKMQQAAANQLHFTAKKTMTLAQRLYEGVELGDEGSVALITYMRTDSVRLSNDAVQAARAYIEKEHGQAYLPAEPNIYKSKKSAQDAHEAIRPTSLDYPPARVKPFLEPDMYRLYELVWSRFLACQMAPAVFDQTAVDIAAAQTTFRANGSIMKFAGYLVAWGVKAAEEEAEEKSEGVPDSDEEPKGELPPLTEGEELALVKLLPEQHFTEPPPRFTEASLVKELEEDGIGRPSTYAQILSTIQDKEYVKKIETRFHPTELGVIVTDLLKESFPTIMDVRFTARMEEELDEIEEGKISYQSVLKDFYGPFKETLAHAEENMRDMKREEIKTDLVCEKCGSPMIIRWGRNGRFLACSGYPECKNTKDFILENGVVKPVEEVPTDEVCPKCGSPMVIKRGRFGRFLACSRYPDCKTSKPLSIGMACPTCTIGYLTERRSRRGKIFYGCNRYPECTFAAWDRPLPETCPSCGSTYLLQKYSKRTGQFIACPNKECDYRRLPEDGEPPGGEESAAG